jgi:outer membrane protein OmpA-like peptidoglycan-associated protein
MKNHLPILLFLFLLANACFAQDSLRSRYGIIGGASFNEQTADFTSLPGVPNCCPNFATGSGTGPYAGAMFEFPIATSFLLSLGANYEDHSATFTAQEPVMASVKGTPTPSSFKHTVVTTLASLGVEPTVAFNAFGRFLVRVGARFAGVTNKSYSQSEVTNAGTFLDSNGNDTHSATRNANSGDIPQVNSLMLHAIIGTEYELPLSHEHIVFLVPAVSYALGLTDIVSGYSWKANDLRAGLGLKYSPPAPPPKRRVYDTVFVRDTEIVYDRERTTQHIDLASAMPVTEEKESAEILVLTTIHEKYYDRRPPKNELSASIAAFGLDNNVEIPDATMRVEEFLLTNTHPLLGYVFFAENSSAIADRYAKLSASDANAFKPERLFSEDALGVSHNILNLIGYNLRRYPQATLTLTGCNSGKGTEKGNTKLSADRVEEIKKYLTQNWGIDAKRIKTVTRNLPEKPSSPNTNDGMEENRRVEITSSEPEVIGVFVVHDIIRTVNPPAIRFRPALKGATASTSWHLTIRQHGNLLKEFSGTGEPTTLDWNLEKEQKSIPRFSQPLSITFEAKNDVGQMTSASKELQTSVITVQKKRGERVKDTVIERYDLVLFDPGKSEITPEHKRTIDHIKKGLARDAVVQVSGYTDRSGEAQLSKHLALDRAQAAAKALGRPDAKVEGVGGDHLLYPNDSPEGRLSCRTVEITVKTPVK